ncbi:MAG: HNH endonuclease, partial [Massilibacteroides sp.]|nr:HNH endonuclease [Massilibacteroides sp.]
QVIIEQHKEWHVQHNGHTSMKVIGYYIEYVAQKQGLDLTHYKPSKPSYYLEGDVVESHGTRYERDPKAKRDCIAKYGCKCFICGFDFEKVYGEDGAGFIEVHHLKPISSYSGEHLVIPTEDLRPLCSNCHSMVHRRKPIPWDVEKVREMIEINNADTLHS